jgi:hypothetical protein
MSGIMERVPMAVGQCRGWRDVPLLKALFQQAKGRAAFGHYMNADIRRMIKSKRPPGRTG